MLRIGGWPLSLAGAVVVGTVGCLGHAPPEAGTDAVKPERTALRPESEVRHRAPSSASEYHVLTVNPSQGSVMINAGRDQGVRPGMTFLVLREGRIFNTIEIEDVFPDMARGVYRNPDQPPQEDDALYSEEIRAIRQAHLRRLENPDGQLRGEVVQVRPELGLVYLDIGERDGVRPEMWFSVMKDGRFVGNVQVRDVYDHLSYAVAAQGGMQIEPGGVALSLERIAQRRAPAQPMPSTAGVGAPAQTGTGTSESGGGYAAPGGDRVANANANTNANPNAGTNANTLARTEAESRQAGIEMLLKAGSGRIEATGAEHGSPDAVQADASPVVPQHATPSSAQAGVPRTSLDDPASLRNPTGTGSHAGTGDQAGTESRTTAEAAPLSPDLFSVFDEFERRRIAEALANADGEPAAMMPAADAFHQRSEVRIDPETLRQLLDVPNASHEDSDHLHRAPEGSDAVPGASGTRPRAMQEGEREMAERANRLLGLEAPVTDKPGRLVAPPVHLTQPDAD